MDGLLRALLVVGVMNLIGLGLVACGDDGQADATLEDRVAQLEAWKLGVEQRLTQQHNFTVTQVDLNQNVKDSMESTHEVMVQLDERVRYQQDALQQLTDIVKDILKRK